MKELINLWLTILENKIVNWSFCPSFTQQNEFITMSILHNSIFLILSHYGTLLNGKFNKDFKNPIITIWIWKISSQKFQKLKLIFFTVNVLNSLLFCLQSMQFTELLLNIEYRNQYEKLCYCRLGRERIGPSKSWISSMVKFFSSIFLKWRTSFFYDFSGWGHKSFWTLTLEWVQK